MHRKMYRRLLLSMLASLGFLENIVASDPSSRINLGNLESYSFIQPNPNNAINNSNSFLVVGENPNSAIGISNMSFENIGTSSNSSDTVEQNRPSVIQTGNNVNINNQVITTTADLQNQGRIANNISNISLNEVAERIEPRNNNHSSYVLIGHNVPSANAQGTGVNNQPGRDNAIPQTYRAEILDGINTIQTISGTSRSDDLAERRRNSGASIGNNLTARRISDDLSLYPDINPRTSTSIMSPNFAGNDQGESQNEQQNQPSEEANEDHNPPRQNIRSSNIAESLMMIANNSGGIIRGRASGHGIEMEQAASDNSEPVSPTFSPLIPSQQLARPGQTRSGQTEALLRRSNILPQITLFRTRSLLLLEPLTSEAGRADSGEHEQNGTVISSITGSGGEERQLNSIPSSGEEERPLSTAAINTVPLANIEAGTGHEHPANVNTAGPDNGNVTGLLTLSQSAGEGLSEAANEALGENSGENRNTPELSSILDSVGREYDQQRDSIVNTTDNTEVPSYDDDDNQQYNMAMVNSDDHIESTTANYEENTPAKHSSTALIELSSRMDSKTTAPTNYYYNIKNITDASPNSPAEKLHELLNNSIAVAPEQTEEIIQHVTNVNSTNHVISDVHRNIGVNIHTRLNSNINPINANFSNAAPKEVGAGDEDSKQDIWIAPFFGQAKQRPDNDNDSYSSLSYGVSMGYDSNLDNGKIIGLALTMSNTDIKYKGLKRGNKTRINSLMLSLYLLQQLPANWFIEGVLTSGLSKIHNKAVRIIDVQGNREVARSNYNSVSWNGQFLLGYNYHTRTIIITPIGGVVITKVRDTGYQEIGTSFQNFTVPKKSAVKVETLLGVSLSGKGFQVNNAIIKPEIRGIVHHARKNKTPAVQMYLEGLENPLVSNNKRPDNTYYTIGFGIGLGYGIAQCLLGHDLQWATKYMSNQTAIKLQVNL